jgi:hypothetical protein
MSCISEQRPGTVIPAKFVMKPTLPPTPTAIVYVYMRVCLECRIDTRAVNTETSNYNPSSISLIEATSDQYAESNEHSKDGNRTKDGSHDDTKFSEHS